VGLLLAGCSTTSSEPAPSASAPALSAPQLSAVAFRLREDEAVGGRFQVKVTNEGDAPVHVTAVALQTDALAPGPATPRDTDLGPQARVDLPVTHGPAVCSAPATDVSAVLTVRTPSGPREVVLPLATTPDSVATLQRIHDESCTAQRLAAVVTTSLVLGDPRREDGALVLPSIVVLQRVPGAATRPTVDLVHVGGSVLYDLQAQDDLPVRLAPRDERAAVPVLVRSTRCSGHEVGEAKKPFDLGAWLSLDGAEEVWTRVDTSPPVQADLRAYLAAACGL
jgi:hypothetical protein